jgi:hypothetical protein
MLACCIQDTLCNEKSLKWLLKRFLKDEILSRLQWYAITAPLLKGHCYERANEIPHFNQYGNGLITDYTGGMRPNNRGRWANSNAGNDNYLNLNTTGTRQHAPHRGNHCTYADNANQLPASRNRTGSSDGSARSGTARKPCLYVYHIFRKYAC